MERITYIPFGNTSDFSIDYLLGIMEDARTTTLQTVQKLSKEEIHWQFAKGWNTIGCLLAHLISAEHFFRIYFIENRELTKSESKKITPGLDMGTYIPQLITNQGLEYYTEQLKQSRKLILDQIKKLTISDFHKKREGYNPNTGHNLAWTLYHLAEDEVHHRGQMTIIKKLYNE